MKKIVTLFLILLMSVELFAQNNDFDLAGESGFAFYGYSNTVSKNLGSASRGNGIGLSIDVFDYSNRRGLQPYYSFAVEVGWGRTNSQDSMAFLIMTLAGGGWFGNDVFQAYFGAGIGMAGNDLQIFFDDVLFLDPWLLLRAESGIQAFLFENVAIRFEVMYNFVRIQNGIRAISPSLGLFFFI